MVVVVLEMEVEHKVEVEIKVEEVKSSVVDAIVDERKVDVSERGCEDDVSVVGL